ncbi:glutathione synthetase isoform X2 [Lepeophtheirus salmonis]|uniref:glutathione synthetase isoform X1 n=1 Tax=Lepeophtheirus salmonis TaxID=72036 RepID=UPI001AE27F0B|nr:glutathione synthetase-like isoform X2 [Lepeophtheirus salmonis]
MSCRGPLKACIPLPIEEDILQDVVKSAKDFAVTHGIGMRYKDKYEEESLYFAPFVLLPSVFPKQPFQDVVDIQPVLNELMHRVAHDQEFLTKTLSQTIECDEFTKKLFDIYDCVMNEGITQCLSLGILRSDFMLDCHQNNSAFCCMKQVEINSIASGFGWLGPASQLIHRYVLTELGRYDLVKNLPKNTTLENIASSMIQAWKVYGSSMSVILFIVEDITYNICDQRLLQFKIQELAPEIKIIRKTLTQVFNEGKLGSSKKELFFQDQEVALVYFRCGYSPCQYPSDDEWKARLMIERSLAIKCPSIYYHLAGTKKVQQELSVPGVLERFLGKDNPNIQEIRKLFAGLYPLNLNEEGDRTLEMVLNAPEKFVLKPQREGGGNNIYGSDIKTFFSELKEPKERNAYIVMDRIWPPITPNYLIVSGKKDLQIEDCVSELGIFGCILGSEDSILFNQQSGHMLRTKSNSSNEGGVASGSGALDSVLLMDIELKDKDSNLQN